MKRKAMLERKRRHRPDWFLDIFLPRLLLGTFLFGIVAFVGLVWVDNMMTNRLIQQVETINQKIR